MQRLLYYPNFEIEDMDFLKFSLLYIDEIQPIIPMCARESLSKETRQIMHSTNLIQPIHPGLDDSYLASDAAIKFLEEQEHYERYESRNWDCINTSGTKDYILYADKFSDKFENYCLENGLGVRCDDGIVVNQDVAYSYMSILANIISADRGLDIITDNNKFSDVRFRVLRGAQYQRERLDEIKREIEFQIPVDIRKIPLEKFIDLRADERFNEARQNFARELNLVLDKQSSGVYTIDMYDYRCCKNEISGLLKEVFVACAAATVGVYSFASAIVNPEKSLAFFSNVGNGVLSLDALQHSVGNSKSYIEQLEQKRQARRYLTRLQRLGLERL